MERPAQLTHGACVGLLPEARGLHEVVSRSVGSKHWTTRRLAEIVCEVVAMR